MQTKALLVLLGLGIVFGSAFLFMKVLIEEISAMELVTGRLALGAAATLLLLAALRRLPSLTPSALRGAAVLAVLDSIIPFTLIAWAETRIDSGVCSVIVSTMPMFTVVFAAVVLPDERLAPGGFAGLTAGFLGVVVLGGAGMADVTSGNTLGLLAVVGAAASYGLAAVVARRLLCDQDALQLTGLKLGVGALIAFAIAFALDGTPDYGSLSVNGTLALLALGILATSVAFATFLWAVQQVGSVRASLVSYIVPVSGLVLGWLVLGEEIGLNTLLGTALIVAGVSTLMQPDRSTDGSEAIGCPIPRMLPGEQYA